jgi:phosphoglycerate dehydrogenase-like enzyme
VLAFGAKAIAYDPYAKPEVFEKLGVQRGELDDVLRAADFLTIHVPDVEQTKNMIGAREFGLLKDGVYFINTARAAAVEEEPLYEAVKSGRIRGAAMDVFWNEPVQPDNRFVVLPNVIATPHIGGATTDVIVHQGEMMCDHCARRRRAAAVPRQPGRPAEARVVVERRSAPAAVDASTPPAIGVRCHASR